MRQTFELIFGVEHNVSLAQMCARAFIVFLYGLLMLRLSGRRTFAQFSAVDMVISFIVGSALSRAMTGSAPFPSVLAAVGVTGLIPKALISTYLSFFPVTVGMVKGLRSPASINLDLMRTYYASRWQVLWKLRLPASLPFLFTSMKVAVAAALVGAIVAELPTGAVAGIGAKLLVGSYYSQSVQMWAALVVGSVMAALLVVAVGIVERVVTRRMGARPA